MPNRKTEELVVAIMTMDRAELIDLLRGINCGFRMDFTDGFLSSISLERLRHLIVAASLQADRVSISA